MSKLNNISVRCDENILLIINEWRTFTLNRVEQVLAYMTQMQIGGIKYFGHTKWLAIQTEITRKKTQIVAADPADYSNNLGAFLDGVDNIYGCNLKLNDIIIITSNRDVLRNSSMGSTQAIEDKMVDSSVKLLRTIRKSAEYTNSLYALMNKSIKVSEKINVDEILKEKYGIIAAKFLVEYIKDNNLEYNHLVKEKVLDSRFEKITPNLDLNELHIAQRMVYSFMFKIINAEPELSVSVPNSIDVIYDINRLIDAKYAAEHGGIGTIYTSMKENIANRLNSIYVAESDGRSSIADISYKTDGLNIKIGGIPLFISQAHKHQWLPFAGCKDRLLQYNENVESIILAKIKQDTENGWNDNIWKENEEMILNIQENQNGELVSAITSYAIDQFDKIEPGTEEELRKLIFPDDLNSDHFLVRAIYDTGLIHINEKKDKVISGISNKSTQKTIHRELIISQMHHSLSFANTIILMFRQNWAVDSAYDELISIEAKKLNFVKRLKTILLGLLDISKMGTYYPTSLKNFAITSGKNI